MAYLKIGKENSADIELYYEDRGAGKPVVLISSWLLSGASWERQAAALLASGYRVITYDRRGFGRSSQPNHGYDYATLASDTHELLHALDLYNATLVGFSMGGGEVARYLGKCADPGRVSKAVFMSSITPAMRHSTSNPEGIDPSVFAGIKQSIEADRFAFLEGFLKNFYNYDELINTRISDAAIQASFNTAAACGYHAMLQCVDAWLEDFRRDLARITVPTLVIHGDSDRILPIDTTGKRTAALIPGARLQVIQGGPHGLFWTHAAEVNKALLEFLAQ